MEKKKIIDKKALGQRIRNEREKLAMSRSNFAELIGLSDYYVGQLERGERQASLPVLVKISQCLRVSLDYLVLGSPQYDDYYIYDSPKPYSCETVKDDEIYELIAKCSHKELELIKKLIKIIISYIN